MVMEFEMKMKMTMEVMMIMTTMNVGKNDGGLRKKEGEFDM